MSIPIEQQAVIRQAIEALNAEFAWLIDHRDGIGVAELFTATGFYDMAPLVFRGHEEIRGFYTTRKARGRRTARHVFSNLRLVCDTPDRATGTVILTLYARDGEPPFPTEPILIADYDDVYARAPDGAWRYESRRIVPVFGGVPNLTGAKPG